MSAASKAALELAYERCCTAIAALYENPRPNYSIDGRSYSWNELRKSLVEEQGSLLTAMQADDGPFEVVTWPPGA